MAYTTNTGFNLGPLRVTRGDAAWTANPALFLDFGVTEAISNKFSNSSDGKTLGASESPTTQPTNVFGDLAAAQDLYANKDSSSSTSTGGTGSTSTTNTSGGDSGGTNLIDGYTPEDYANRLSGAFSETLGALDLAEQSYRNDYNTQAKATTDLYNSQVPLINTARDNAMNLIQQAQTAAEQGSNKALAGARELGGQLTQRANNMFGSGALSGVGQAAQEIFGRELQRNTGDIRQNLVNNIEKLNNERVNVQREADNKVQQVQVQLQQAISNLQAQLNSALRDVNNMRGEVAGNRDQIALDLMREYRARARQLQDEARSFAQQIAIETGQANTYLSQLMGQYNQALQGYGSNALNTSNTIITEAMRNSGRYSDTIGTSNDLPAMNMAISGFRNPEEEQSV